MTLCDYECQACHAEFEAESASRETAWEVECPRCGSTDVTRLWRAPAVIYRGSGWYVTDKDKRG